MSPGEGEQQWKKRKKKSKKVEKNEFRAKSLLKSLDFKQKLECPCIEVDYIQMPLMIQFFIRLI